MIASSIAHLVAHGAEHIYVDFDIDVIDRAFAPACPASLPGGMQPEDLLRAAYLLGADGHVVAADLCEVDANADVNGMTVRLMAATFLYVLQRSRPCAQGRVTVMSDVVVHGIGALCTCDPAARRRARAWCATRRSSRATG